MRSCGRSGSFNPIRTGNDSVDGQFFRIRKKREPVVEIGLVTKRWLPMRTEAFVTGDHEFVAAGSEMDSSV